MSVGETEMAARLEAAGKGVLNALDAAGIRDDPAELATAVGVALGCLARATLQPEGFIQAAVAIARATAAGEMDG